MLKGYLIVGVNAVDSDWVTVAVLGVDNHASDRTDRHQCNQTRNVDPHCSASYNTHEIIIICGWMVCLNTVHCDLFFFFCVCVCVLFVIF